MMRVLRKDVGRQGAPQPRLLAHEREWCTRGYFQLRRWFSVNSSGLARKVCALRSGKTSRGKERSMREALDLPMALRVATTSRLSPDVNAIRRFPMAYESGDNSMLESALWRCGEATGEGRDCRGDANAEEGEGHAKSLVVPRF